ncbi:hypothetical protein AB0B15_42560 [Streptomyces sp. NPDC045456]|uniref:hypothetical protein n=1 Tax=Streptomyces sp. NPDC045456 TaxID=3155254 RepID=UPI0033DD965E
MTPTPRRGHVVYGSSQFRAGLRAPAVGKLAELHDRKARAFRLWADVSGERSLRHEAQRAEQAAQTTREMRANRGGTADGGPVVQRLLTRTQAAGARTVLTYTTVHAPSPQAEVRLAVLMLAADWLSEADTDANRLRGRLAERVRPLGALL